jgi:phytoene dehydrogenase-like protein
VPTAVANGYTASGYGYPSEMPYAYLHEFARTSMMGKIWRVKGGYESFWQKISNRLPDVRCNVKVENIDRSGDKVQIHILSSTSQQRTKLEFDKVIMTGSLAYPQENPTYRSLPSTSSGQQSLNRHPSLPAESNVLDLLNCTS